MLATDRLRLDLLKWLQRAKKRRGLQRVKALNQGKTVVRTAIKDSVPIEGIIDLIDELERIEKW